MSDEFGDDGGADDQLDASGADIDVLAVTIRYHEERVLRRDTRLGYWHELDEENQAVALVIGQFLVDEIRQHPNPRLIANRLQRLREYLGGEPIREERREDRDQIELLIVALRNEGTLR